MLLVDEDWFLTLLEHDGYPPRPTGYLSPQVQATVIDEEDDVEYMDLVGKNPDPDVQRWGICVFPKGGSALTALWLWGMENDPPYDWEYEDSDLAGSPVLFDTQEDAYQHFKHLTITKGFPKVPKGYNHPKVHLFVE
jgi:hypothetical protein